MDTTNNSSITTKHLYVILTFWSHHEIFIRTTIRFQRTRAVLHPTS